jgi:hypothetical protein
MKDEELNEVIAAMRAGKVVQKFALCEDLSREWADTTTVVLEFDRSRQARYRVKPREPEGFWAVLYPEGGRSWFACKQDALSHAKVRDGIRVVHFREVPG